MSPREAYFPNSQFRKTLPRSLAQDLRLGADFPCQVAHRFFIASEMRMRAAGLMPGRFFPGAAAAWFALGGRPRRAGEESPCSAEMAWSILRSALRSESKLWMSTNVLSNGVGVVHCSSRLSSQR